MYRPGTTWGQKLFLCRESCVCARAYVYIAHVCIYVCMPICVLVCGGRWTVKVSMFMILYIYFSSKTFLGRACTE